MPYSEKVEITKKRLGKDPKGKDAKKMPKATISPIAKGTRLGLKVTQKFAKGGMTTKKKGC